jgi:hypothetical protein
MVALGICSCHCTNTETLSPHWSFIRGSNGFFALVFTCDVRASDHKLLSANSPTEALAMGIFLFPLVALCITRECDLMKCSGYATRLPSKGAMVMAGHKGSIGPLGKKPTKTNKLK